MKRNAIGNMPGVFSVPLRMVNCPSFGEPPLNRGKSDGSCYLFVGWPGCGHLVAQRNTVAAVSAHRVLREQLMQPCLTLRAVAGR